MRLIITFLPLFLIGSILAAQPPFLAFDDPEYQARNLENINSERDDYAPFITPDGGWLFFTSSRLESADLYRLQRIIGGGEILYEDPALVRDDGINSTRDDGVLSVPVPMETYLGYSVAEKARSGVSSVTGVMATGSHVRHGYTGIFTFDMAADGSAITNLRELDVLNSRKWESQPTIASDASFIILTSTRRGGEGGKDLWISHLGDDGRYGTPQNMGDRINSDDDEITPFIAPDNRTLFFSSDGRGGQGGFDIFVSIMDEAGEWGTPINLGPMVNGPANELFFYGVNREVCYFVSDREGGKGGLDIYEGSFNPFLPGYGTLRVKILDTTRNRYVNGRLEVTEERFGERLVGDNIMGETGGSAWLYAGFPYHAQIEPEGFDTLITLPVAPLATDENREMVIYVASPPIPIAPPLPVVVLPDPPPTPPGPPMLPPDGPSGPPPPPPPAIIALDFAGINVPLFVSGYYRLNTLVSLEELRARQGEGGDLAEETYIEDVTDGGRVYETYRKQAMDVESIVGEFYRKSVNDYFPAFDTLRESGEYLQLTVYGFADPRPIFGQFDEEIDVTFETMNGMPFTMGKGSELDNFRLAGLRAFFAVEYLDKLFRDAAAQGRDEYIRLRQANAVRWRIVSGEVDAVSGNTLADKRRIHVTVQRLKD